MALVAFLAVSHTRSDTSVFWTLGIASLKMRKKKTRRASCQNV